MTDMANAIVSIECGECGVRKALPITAGRGVFLETGWRFGDLSQNRPAFRCDTCRSAAGAAELLTVRKDYLAHMFEAQQRFGE